MLKRYELVLTEDHGRGRIETFTWGETRSEAYARTVDTMEDPTWDGWSFELATQHTLIDGK